MTGRGQANALTRATALLAAAFFATSLILSVLASYNRAPRSILDGAQPALPRLRRHLALRQRPLPAAATSSTS